MKQPFEKVVVAILAGFRPCGPCCKDRYTAWKDARERGEP